MFTELKVKLVRKSGNRKVGPIPVSTTESRTCPDACSWKGNGCYAEQHWTAQHWKRVQKTGVPWSEFCEQVRALPHGQLWRHNEAGDLPGDGDRLDTRALRELADANVGKRGFTYTHKPLRRTVERAVIQRVNADGFTVNLSADSLQEADRKADLGIGPVVCVVPRDFPDRGETPAGRPVLVCLNDTQGLSCAECKLCSVAARKSIVAFRAHGAQAKRVELAQLRLSRDA